MKAVVWDLLSCGPVTVLQWLVRQPKNQRAPDAEPLPQKARPTPYLITGGAEITATDKSDAGKVFSIPAGSRVALVGDDTYRKHYFCDWLLGYVDNPDSPVTFKVGAQLHQTPASRTQVASVLGRSPLLYGETIQEALLYRTNNVRKQDLYHLIERFYGPSLRARTSPQNPLFDLNGKPVPTQVLTACEHLEIAQINILLQKTPLVVIDLSSELMNEALSQGFRPAATLFSSGKTIIAILPPGRDFAWAEAIMRHKFTAEVRF